jgi:hypothetical protein
MNQTPLELPDDFLDDDDDDACGVCVEWMELVESIVV